MLTMVYLSFGLKYDLVTEDYYAEEIKFQDKIDSKIRVREQDLEPRISIENKMIQVNFPNANEALYSGRINCFRPSDENKDFLVEFTELKDSEQIPLNKFSKGKYLVKIEWSDGKQLFYNEQTIIIP